METYYDSEEVKKGLGTNVPGSMELNDMPATKEEQRLALLRMEKKDLERRLMEIQAEMTGIRITQKNISKSN